MALNCPSCSAKIPWYKIRKEFSCPTCGHKLVADIGRPTLVTVILWILLDIPLRLSVATIFGFGSNRVLAMRVLFSGALGWLIATIVFKRLCDVRLHSDSDKHGT